MDCVRSFSFSASANENVVSPNIRTWGTAPQNYWIYESSAGSSTFNIQGFKNINIFSIEAVGNVGTLTTTGSSGVLVQDWSFLVQINGQNPLVNGNITASPNRFSIVSQPTGPLFELSKYNPKLELADPISSPSSIQINRLNASGIGAQNLTQINLAWFMTFVVYYKYEGE
jgi:hypothetical protein